MHHRFGALLWRKVHPGLALVWSGSRALDRARLAVYLGANAFSKCLGMGLPPYNLTLHLSPDLDISVKAFASHLGPYLDVWHYRIYQEVPGFAPQPGQVVVDGGAHVGFFTLQAARAVGPSGRVYAFEPNPPTFELLKRNVERNGVADRVTCIPRALTSREGVTTLWADPSLSSIASLYRPENHPHTAGATVVQTTTLDRFVEEYGVRRIDLLKLDTEGAEAEIIRGGLKLAVPMTRRVVMESHNTRFEVRDLLSSYGVEMVLDNRRTHIVYFQGTMAGREASGLPGEPLEKR